MTKIDIKNSKDTTLERNTIKQWEFLIAEYLLIKNKKHPRFIFVNEFYNCYNITRQNFIKYYNRYKLSKLNNNCSIEEINKSLLPQKRGPKYLSGRTIFNKTIIDKIKELRIKYGLNRYNIKSELESIYYYNNTNNNINTNKSSNNTNNKNINTNTCNIKLPSYSTIYNILKNNNINKLNNEMIGNSKKK